MMRGCAVHLLQIVRYIPVAGRRSATSIGPPKCRDLIGPVDLGDSTRGCVYLRGRIVRCCMMPHRILSLEDVEVTAFFPESFFHSFDQVKSRLCSLTIHRTPYFPLPAHSHLSPGLTQAPSTAIRSQLTTTTSDHNDSSHNYTRTRTLLSSRL